jgi:hypothetical protein
VKVRIIVRRETTRWLDSPWWFLVLFAWALLAGLIVGNLSQ